MIVTILMEPTDQLVRLYISIRISPASGRPIYICDPDWPGIRVLLFDWLCSVSLRTNNSPRMVFFPTPGSFILSIFFISIFCYIVIFRVCR